MRRHLDDIKIVEPPIEELTKRHRSFTRFCLTGCGCVVLFLIGAVVALRLATGPGPQTLKTLPATFPQDVPVYDVDGIERITFISGKYKNRGIEIAAFFPKIILSPLFMNLESKPEGSTNSTSTGQIASLKNLWRIITTPVGDHRDTLQVEWNNLSTDQYFLVNFYKKELIKKDFKIDVESEGQNIYQFSFSRADGVSGSFYTKNEEGARGRTGTSYAILTINLAASNE